MSIQHFSSGTRFLWQGHTYEILRLLPDNQVNIQEISLKATLLVKMSVLVQALFNGELQFVLDGKPLQSPEQREIIIASERIDLSDFPEKLVALAKSRMEIIQPLITMEKRTRKAVKERVREVNNGGLVNKSALRGSVSVASIYRWIRDYTNSGNDLRSLIPVTNKCGSKGASRLCPGIESMLNKVIEDKYYVREKVTIEDIRNELVVRITEENHLRSQSQQLSIPSLSTLTRRIRNLEPYKKLMAKRGSREAKQKFSQYGQTVYPTMPLERVEMDHTISDLIVIDDRDSLPLGRLTLTYCLDMATRYPLGYYMGFEPPSYLAVMECLYHAIRPKEDIRTKYGTEHDWDAYGIPSVLMVDNAKEFIGTDLEDACLLLGIVLQQAPIRTPQFKAGIERNYRTLNTMFFHTLPGTTFSNVRERGTYDSEKQACVYLSDVDKMLNLFIVDVYAQQFHQGLNGIPARRWKEMTQYGFMPGLPPNAKELSILLGRTTLRVIHHYGIEFDCLRYNCDDLLALRTLLKGEKAKIKYHPADMSYLYVYDPFEKRYIHVPALDQDYTQGLSLWKHRVIRQTALMEQDSVNIVALGQAKRKIQEIVEQGRNRKRQHTRTRTARWDTAGKPTRELFENTQMKGAGNKNIKPDTGGQVIPLVKKDSPINLQPNQESDADWEIVYRKDIFKDKKEKPGGEKQRI